MQFESSLKPKLIYVFRINDDAHKGCLKVGEATCHEDDVLGFAPCCKALNQAAKARIDQYTQTAGISYKLLYTELTLFVRDKHFCSFNDKEVHNVLLRSGIKRKTFDINGQANEWFITDLETVKRAITAVKEGKTSLTAAEISTDRSPIIFRPEQREAIDKTKEQFRHGSKQMLWNAKMRFGKTLSALQVVKEIGFQRTLILTHRPVVDAGWFEDFGKIFYDTPDYAYGSKNNGESHDHLENWARKKEGLHYVYFASMQDLRGSEQVGGNFNKNDSIFSTPWDFIIVDEAHEGTQTTLGKAVMGELVKPATKVLRLSGTPFNLLDDYKEEEIYTWDYVMEQRAKAQWDLTHFGDPNPYAGLPQMNIYTYDLGRLLHEYVDEEIAFNFSEFFRVSNDGAFVHEQDVWAFLHLLSKEDEDSYYPFANETYRHIFRHTLWMLPGVAAAKALQAMLLRHPVFQHFQVVNVAGDGTREEESRDALTAVKNAITDDPDQTRTITLSCGRLTTGVSVKAWTAVLMLSGGYTTGASTYMQTIFRVQTPATINGRTKEQCYVFDFAPDRTLRVLAETAKISAKAGKTSEGDRQAMGDFLNFCPVISVEGSQMTPFDVPRMLEQLKRAYIERVVNNGFEDNSLYNDELLKLDEVALRDFAQLKKTIGATKASHQTRDIDINTQGLTNEEYEESEKLQKKKKRELTDEEKRRLAELKEKKKNRENAISILRGISIRMPLMIYGAEVKDEEESITIDNFASLIDPQSWEEFMPRGVTKQEFNKFKRYYDPEIFAAAAKRIRAIARAADRLSVEERIERITSLFATFHNPDKETVLTPWRVVNMHLAETLGGFCFYDEPYEQPIREPRLVDRGAVTAQVFSPNSHVLEINSKTGLYPLYVAYSIYRALVKEQMFAPERLEDEQALWDRAVANNVFVICKTPMAKSITRRTLVGFRPARVNTRYFEDLINQIKNKSDNFIAKVARGKSFWKANNNDNMKFDAVVGNPPYQEENDNSRKPPIYHLFYDISCKLCEKVTFITPARFLFRAGQTPKEWAEKMLNNEHFKVVRFYQKSTDVFSSVDIKGGVAIGYYDKRIDFGKIGFFSEYQELSSILDKVKARHHDEEQNFSSYISSQGLYRFTQKAFKDFPQILKVQGKGTGAKIISKTMAMLPELFTEQEGADNIKMLGLIGGKRTYRYIRRDYVEPNPYLDTYNVFVPEANGTGAIGEVLSTPVIGVPVIGHTDTFLSIGMFADAQEASACLEYVKTKFARCLLGTLKVTQHNGRDTWMNVPLQDFTSNSDIDWSQSVANIDRQLYAKYQLSAEEIEFIERMIKPM